MVSKKGKPTVVVVGMGVVGLPVALILAQVGYKVIGVDTSKELTDSISNGKLSSRVKEKELEYLLRKSEVKRNLTVQQTPVTGDVYIIAVPTPLVKSQKKADLSFVKKAVESVAPYLNKGNLVIIESTMPPLTCRNVITPILESRGFVVGKDIFLAHCPERILPGNIYYEIIHNDRIIGGVDEKSSEMAASVYESFVKGRIHITDDVTAELCKLMENSYRDVNIALANEFALVAKGLGIDPKSAINFSNKHPRVNILDPGIGVGGHCIPIDPWFIHEVDSKNSRLIAIARAVNDKMPYKIVDLIEQKLKGIKNPKIVAIGASYKPDTVDTRESPAIEVVKLLKKAGLDVSHYDPLIENYKYPGTLVDACLNASLLVILVPHKVVLKELNNRRKEIISALKKPLILEF